MEAEREIIQLKKIQSCTTGGETYAGFVSASSLRPLRRARDVFVEGLVHVSALAATFYDHLEREHVLCGAGPDGASSWAILRVTVAGVSIERRQIDFRSRRSRARRAAARAPRTAMAAALLSLLLVLGSATAAAARGAEADPARRSMVVEAVERASPAVVNVSTSRWRAPQPRPFPTLRTRSSRSSSATSSIRVRSGSRRPASARA